MMMSLAVIRSVVDDPTTVRFGGVCVFPSSLTFFFSVASHGNYHGYYGYRWGQDGEEDSRLAALRPQWFDSQTRVLDIGCNSGQISLAVGQRFGPASVVGIDIDVSLVKAAQKNAGRSRSGVNTTFLHGDFLVLDGFEDGSFDVVLCLSVVKWMHLNGGDDAVLKLFRKVFSILRKGGKFVFEPQPWKSYKSNAKVTPRVLEIYKTLKLRPDDFIPLLLAQGFSTVEVLLCGSGAKGFDSRSLFVLTK